jgi:hypothetical protein
MKARTGAALTGVDTGGFSSAEPVIAAAAHKRAVMVRMSFMVREASKT